MCCPPVEEDTAIKHLIEPGVSLCPAKQYSSCTIYGASSVQVVEKVLGHTCQVIQLLDFTPQCARSQRKSLTMQVQRGRSHDGLLQI